MGAQTKRRFYQGLRFKLLLAALTLLAIPWAGYRTISETESFLAIAQEQLLLGQAEMLAKLMPARAKAYLARSNQANGQPLANAFYVHPLEQGIQLDGYPEEWRLLFSQRRRFVASATNPGAISFDLILGYDKKTLYLLLQVDDAKPVYARSDDDPGSGDHLLIALPGENGRTRQYLIGTSAPGWVTGYRLVDMQPAPSIRGEWQESARGYNIELQLPLELTEGSLSLAMVDRDNPDAVEIAGRAATSGLQYNTNLSLLLIPQSHIQHLLQRVDEHNVRIRIINRQRQVVGQNGKLAADPWANREGILQRLITAFLPPDRGFSDPRENLGRLDGPEIRQALQGSPASYPHWDQARGMALLSAAYPIQEDNVIEGAVVIEKYLGELLSIQQQALERLVLISLGLFLFTGITLLWFAGRLTGRITQVSRKINTAVSDEGRIRNAFVPDRQTDELGEMEQIFAAVMQRLQEYHRYLESMASRLAHEFRTPLVMVNSSLENLAQDNDPNARKRYLSRAAEGTQRLTLILERMREATRLEQALQMAIPETVDLVELVRRMTENYAASYPETRFESRTPQRSLWIDLAPELIIQALDKLVSNAVDFHTSGTPILIRLESSKAKVCELQVINQGPDLPDAMQCRLFDSMVSLRDKTTGEPHLGLGLYLVRLIAEYHQGRVYAKNIDGGVCFCLQLPLNHAQ